MIAMTEIAGYSQIQIDKSVRLSNLLLGGVERLVALNLSVARDLLADNTSSVKALSEVKDVQGLIALQQQLSQPTVDKAIAVAKSVYEVGSSTQSELSKFVEENVVEFNKSLVTSVDKALKSAPAGSEVVVSALKAAVNNAVSAYDTVSKTASKVTADLTQAGVAAAETSAKAASSAAARPAAKKAAATAA